MVISLTVPFAFLGGGGLLPYLIATVAETGSFRIGLICAGLFIAPGSLLLPLIKAAGISAAGEKTE